MHNLREFRKNLTTYKKKLADRNTDFDLEKFAKLDNTNRNLITKKESLEQEKKNSFEDQR